MSKDHQAGRDLARQIGARITDLRERCGLSQRTAAAAIGASVQMYNNREKGITELKSSEMVILADLFGVDETAFFAGLAWTPPPEKDLLRPQGFEADEAETLVRLLAGIPNSKVRQDMADAVKAISRAESDDENPAHTGP